jgi:hypothetical protein
MAGAAATGMAMLIGTGLSGFPARAAYIVTLVQEGSDVVQTGTLQRPLAALPLGVVMLLAAPPRMYPTGPAGRHRATCARSARIPYSGMYQTGCSWCCSMVAQKTEASARQVARKSFLQIGRLTSCRKVDPDRPDVHL